MIELEERYLKLIQKLEKVNYRKYDVITLNDHYYINASELLLILDDTQDEREHVEEKLEECIEDYETRKEENTPGLLNSYQKECERLKEENTVLRRELMYVCNEDSYDRLAFEGVEL